MKITSKLIIILFFLNFTHLHAQQQIQTQDQTQLVEKAIKQIDQFEKIVSKEQIGFEQPPAKSVILADLKEAKIQIIDLKKSSKGGTLSTAELEFTRDVIDKLNTLKVEGNLSIEETEELRTTLSLSCSSENDSFPIEFITVEKGKPAPEKRYRVFMRNILAEDITEVAGGKTTTFKEPVPKGLHFFWVQDITDPARRTKEEIMEVTCRSREKYFYIN